MLYPKIQALSTKGQVVVPAQFRKFLNLHPQSKVLIDISSDNKKITLEPINPIKALRGSLKGMIESPLEIKRAIRAEEEVYEKKRLRS